MRNLRFELSESSPARETARPLFAHVAFAEDQSSGFNSLRELLRHAQQRRVPPFSVIVDLARATPWLLRAIWWRFFEKRLLYPDAAELQVHLVIEQLPRPENRIRLSAEKVDQFGQPLAEIAWSVAAQDQQNMAQAVAALTNFWNTSSLATMARFVPRLERLIKSELACAGGVYHPGGSTRMATSPALGVVDGDLRVFGLRNVSVASTSVFPTGGGANPTMMLLMLALRLVDQILSGMARQGQTTPTGFNR
jgi:choline dehydrogenase-like flavoprotein